MPGQSRPWRPTPSWEAGAQKPWVVRQAKSVFLREGDRVHCSRGPGWADLGRQWTDGQMVGEEGLQL